MGQDAVRFIVEIDLGNDAMRSGPDICWALDRLARKIENARAEEIGPDLRGPVVDANGNTVGKWWIE